MNFTHFSIFTGLSPKDFSDPQIYEQTDSYDIDDYIKKRVSVPIIKDRDSDESKPRSLYEMYIGDDKDYDAYMDLNIPDARHALSHVQFILGNEPISDFYWNEESRSWKAHFTDSCPFFDCFTNTVVYLQGLGFDNDSYSMEMTLIRFNEAYLDELTRNPFITLVRGKIMVYQSNCNSSKKVLFI